MRCKKHITDGSSRVGVCASCLRERLFALVEAQARSAAAVQQQIDHHEDHRKSNYSSQPHQHQQQQPPPLIFPGSVSPYVCRRPDNNNDSSWQHQNQNSRFYSTPQLGPNTNPLNDTANTTISSSSAVHKKKKNRFRILSNLFRSSHRSVVVIGEQEPIPDPNSTVSRASFSTSSPISSSTWYSSFIPNRTRKTTQESPCRSTTTTNHHHHRPHRNKGLSPNYTEEEDNIGPGDEEDINNIGYVSESSPGWRKSAATTPGRQRKGGQNGNHNSSKSVSMVFCLSPLVRASPKRPSRNPKDTGFSGEIRVSSSVHNLSHHNPNLSTAASFCANRSRKIANFGRYNNNYNP